MSCPLPTHIRVLVQDIPPLLNDIVCGAIAREPDLELLPSSKSCDLNNWRGTDPDIIVVSTPDTQWHSKVGHWLNRWPRARVVVIEISGRETVIYELRPHATPLGALSPEQLVAVIRNPPDE